MKKYVVSAVAVLCLAAAALLIYRRLSVTPVSQTPFERHGKLHVDGGRLVDAQGGQVQLRGVSTSHVGWYPQFIGKDTFQTLRDDWKVQFVRIVMYTEAFETGYCDSDRQEEFIETIDRGVQAATELGMYVIINWHTLNDGDPNQYADAAEDFFSKMSQRYAQYGNVIYEICNEPNGDGTWERVKTYAQRIIPVIRTHVPDSLILVGTADYAQAVDQAADDPLTEFENIMYTLHFYAGSFKQPLRDKLAYALEKELPVFISECSITEAVLDGKIDFQEGELWFDMVDEYKLSYAAFSICNADEVMALVKADSSSVSDWKDEELSTVGKWFKKRFIRTWEEEGKVS